MPGGGKPEPYGIFDTRKRVEMIALISLIAALALEQWRPLSIRHHVFGPFARYADFLERQFNAGESQHGVIGWIAAVAPAVIGSWLIYALLAWVSHGLALLFNVAVLYLMMGFRQFSHHFTDINLALKQDDLVRARELLTRWRGHPCDHLDREEIVRLTIEEALVASHHHVFAVVVWFVILPGPSGAVLYRLSAYLRRRWGEAGTPELATFGSFAARAFSVLEWLPVRMTAAAFAIVGDFEDAIYCWRTQASRWPDPAIGIVLASGAGALGVRLGNPYVRDGDVVERPEIGAGDEADVGFLDSTVGLVWRALVLWLVLLILLGVASAVR